MEFIGIIVITYCLWLAQVPDDSQKKREQEIEKRVREKLKNEQALNIRVIEKL